MACVANDLRKTYIMIEPFFLGFGLGLSLILAIGAQNAFVLKAGLMRRFVLPIVLLCAASDALLIFLGVLGLGTLLEDLAQSYELDPLCRGAVFVRLWRTQHDIGLARQSSFGCNGRGDVFAGGLVHMLGADLFKSACIS